MILILDFRFVKYPGRYYKLDIDYSEDNEVQKLAESKIESKLEKPVQEVIKVFIVIARSHTYKD